MCIIPSLVNGAEFHWLYMYIPLSISFNHNSEDVDIDFRVNPEHFLKEMWRHDMSLDRYWQHSASQFGVHQVDYFLVHFFLRADYPGHLLVDIIFETL